MMIKPLWIKDPLAILAPGAESGIVIAGGRVAELVPASAAPTVPDAVHFDASAHVVLPGLINTHHHFYQTLTRATPASLDRPLFGWLTALYPVWARLTPAAMDAAATAALAELLLSGCTTTTDHHYVFPRGLEQAIDIEIAAAQALGMRVTVTRGSMNRSQRDGGLPPDAGFLLNSTQRPAELPERDHLFLLLFAQDIAHVDGGYSLPLSNVLTTFSLAGFQVTTIGRFWVTAEGSANIRVCRIGFLNQRSEQARVVGQLALKNLPAKPDIAEQPLQRVTQLAVWCRCEKPFSHDSPMRRRKCAFILAFEVMKKAALGHPCFVADVLDRSSRVAFRADDMQAAFRSLFLIRDSLER